MYELLLPAHSFIRFAILALMLAVIAKSAMGTMQRSPFQKVDNTLSLLLLIITHVHFLIGLGLYFTSPNVQFVAGMMKDPTLRYWAVEHITIMLIAVALITIGRVRARKASDDTAKHRNLLIFNSIALLLIVVGIFMATKPEIGRGFFHITGFTG